MPRGRKKKFKLDFNVKTQTLKSVLAVSLILLAGLSIISFFAGDYAINSKIQHLLKGSFGSASFILPIVFLLFALLLIDSIKWKIKEPRILIGIILILVVLSGFLHVFYSGDEALTLAKKGMGGGIVGFKLTDLLKGTISVYGAVLVLIAGFAVSVFLIFDISFDQILPIFSSISEKIKAAKASKKKLDDNISISSGTDGFAEEEATDGDSSDSPKDKKSKKNTPSFEIIASMSEPQGNMESSAAEDALKASNTAVTPKPSLPYSDKVWETPPVDLLSETSSTPPDRGDINEKAKIIKDTLKSFGINVEVVDIQSGPAVTQYALEAETGTKISKIANLQYDLAMALSSPTGSVRIEAPIPGKSLIGIEVPNNSRSIVSFKSLLTADPMKNLKSKLGIVLGKDVGGLTRAYDIGKMPHLLVAGATGSGKSVFLHSLIFSILYRASPQECKFILMDPKRTELVHYNDIPHLLTPVVTDVDKAPSAFKWAVNEMERRYKMFESAKARNIETYNEKSGFQALPYIVIIVDELAEIMIVDPAAVEKSIIRIAQLARATGIHLVLAVQRPSTNIITGLIKANIPCRIAFNVASQIDSRVIIDQPGAEKLLGKGDMLFVPPDMPKPVRLQGAFVTDKEISNLVGFLKNAGVSPEYNEEIFEMNDKVSKSVSSGGEDVDELFEEAREIIVSSGKASASLLQRRLSIGYARAARIIDELEQMGIIGPAVGSKPREILVKRTNNLTSEDFDIADNQDLPVEEF